MTNRPRVSLNFMPGAIIVFAAYVSSRCGDNMEFFYGVCFMYIFMAIATIVQLTHQYDHLPSVETKEEE